MCVKSKHGLEVISCNKVSGDSSSLLLSLSLDESSLSLDFTLNIPIFIQCEGKMLQVMHHVETLNYSHPLRFTIHLFLSPFFITEYFLGHFSSLFSHQRKNNWEKFFMLYLSHLFDERFCSISIPLAFHLSNLGIHKIILTSKCVKEWERKVEGMITHYF